MTQDLGREEDSDAGASEESTVQDLPDFLRTEPIPVISPPQEPEATGEADASQAPEREPAQEPAQEAEQEVEEAPEVEKAPEFADLLAVPEVKKKKAKKSKGKKIALIGAGAVLALAAAYVGTAWFFADRVPVDTTVAGVDISGLSSDAAIERLNTELDEVIHADIEVALGTAQAMINPESAGLSVDIPGTVDGLVGFSLDPERVFSHLFGRGAEEPIIHSSGAELRQAIEAIENNLNVAPVEGELALIDSEVQTVEPEDGLAIDVDEAMGHIVEQWLQGPRPVELPGVAVPPAMGPEQLAQVRQTIIDPLFSGAIELTVNDETVSVSQEMVLEVASLRLVGTSYQLELDSEPLTESVKELLPGLGESPTDAKFIFEDGKPVIVPSITGTGINPETLANEVARAAIKTGEARAVVLELEATEPEFTTADAEALGIVERVSHFKTPVPYDPPRTQNLITGAKNLTGILIKPGETFSLIEALGPIDAAHGYTSSGVVVNGFSDTAMGGGLSQMSTTTFNAAFEAGMEDVYHQPHSRHFTRYPEGREATMFAPELDMKWRNNTPYGVLVQSWIDGDAHVALWSTKYWDTKITTGPRTNITAPQTVYNTGSRCTPERGGASGFTVSVQRIVSKDGVRNDEYSRSYSHTYQPWNNVVCGPKPPPEPAPSSSPDPEESTNEDED